MANTNSGLKYSVATPENEGEFLRIAMEGTANHVEKLVRAYRRALNEESLEEVQSQHEERFLEFYTDEDGMMVIKARLTPEVGTTVKKTFS